jgi:hypothetical protein
MTKKEQSQLCTEFGHARDLMINEFLRSSTEHLRIMIQNDPCGLTHSDVVDRCLNVGIISAMACRHEYSIEPSAVLAAALLEDVNAHSEARYIRVSLLGPPEVTDIDPVALDAKAGDKND